MTSWKHRTRSRRTLSDIKSYRKSCFTSHKRKAFIINQRRNDVYAEKGDKTHYEDCDYHPCVITTLDIENDDIRGVSLIDGTTPRSCSLDHCGVSFFTKQDAEARANYYKHHGREKYLENYDSFC